MKRFLIVSLMILAVTSLTFLGSTAQVIAKEKPIIIKFAYHGSETTAMANTIIKPWLKTIEEATNNRVKMEVYWAQTLCKAKDHYDSVANGLADMAWVITVYTPGRFPVSEIVMLPFLGFPDGEISTRVLWELYEKTPEMQNEYKNVKLLFLNGSGPAQLATSKKRVLSSNDLKGLKIRAVAGPCASAVKKMGAVPIPMSIMDIYPSMEKGVIEGVFLSFDGIQTRKIEEVTKYYSMVNLYCLPFPVVMNKNKWNSLPPDIQNQIMSVSGLNGGLFWAKAREKMVQDCQKMLEKMPGKEIIYPTNEDAQTFVDAGKSVWNDYINKMNAKGLPGQRIFDDMISILNKYK